MVSQSQRRETKNDRKLELELHQAEDALYHEPPLAPLSLYDRDHDHVARLERLRSEAKHRLGGRARDPPDPGAQILRTLAARREARLLEEGGDEEQRAREVELEYALVVGARD